MNKAKLIVIDDEKVNADGVANLINISQLPVEVAGVFYSGLEAKQYLENNQVDLMITDIQMPEVTGLDLCQLIHEKNPQAKTIIFTGVATLDYAKKAMRFGVKHFIFKPVSPIELQDSIIDCLNDLADIQNNQLLLLKEQLNHIILNNEETSDTLPEFSLIMFEEQFADRLQSVITAQLRNGQCLFTSTNLKGVQLFYLFQIEELSSILRGIESFDIRCVIFTAEKQRPSMITSTFKKGQISLEDRFYFDKLTIIDECVVLNKNYIGSKRIPEFQPLVDLIRDNEYTKAREFCVELLEHCRDKKVPAQDLKDRFFSFVKKVINEFDFDDTKGYINFLNQINEITYYLQLVDLLDDLLDRVSNLKKKEQLNDTISANINYILEKNYHNPELSLRWISKNLLFLNPDYLGKTYFKETGMKFSDRLLELRLSKGVTLLQKGKKVAQVAELIGYGNNPDYFGQLFKKKYGVSPKRYQKDSLNKSDKLVKS